MAKKETKTIVIDGIEYISKATLAERTNYTIKGLEKKLKKTSVQPIKDKGRLVLFRLSEVIEAENRGEFTKYL